MANERSTIEVCTLLGKLDLHPIATEFCEVEIGEKRLSVTAYGTVHNILKKHGYELIIDRKQILVEKVKCVIIDMIYHSKELPPINYSQYISEKIGVNYTYLSKLFSKETRTTIQQFIITHKIERVKEILLYDVLTLSEIAWKMHYSSTAHLSAQFRKVTGLSPTIFKKLKTKNLTRTYNFKGKWQNV